MKKFLILSLTAFLFLQHKSIAQVSAGIYQQNLNTYVSVGTDPDEKMFGEVRLGAGDELDLEGTFGYNFVQKQEVNFYSGAHLGVANLTTDYSEAYIGVPLGLFVKPFSATPNLGFLLEASPLVGFDSGDGYFRAGIGLKYTFR